MGAVATETAVATVVAVVAVVAVAAATTKPSNLSSGYLSCSLALAAPSICVLSSSFSG